MSKLAHSDEHFMREIETRKCAKEEPEVLQIQFERLTVSIIGDAEEIAHIDKLTNLEVGPVELTSINNAITKLQAFVLKHRRKVAA
ncbi:MAG: hypothetical protein KF826_03420 [Xanthobacteraceae bacterium]|nr:hypothetical protein [Xanthobacteraceae bacterium]MCW5679664.1 hypothetical protein [Xanthobacteraceae bacterium]